MPICEKYGRRHRYMVPYEALNKKEKIRKNSLNPSLYGSRFTRALE